MRTAWIDPHLERFRVTGPLEEGHALVEEGTGRVERLVHEAAWVAAQVDHEAGGAELEGLLDGVADLVARTHRELHHADDRDIGAGRHGPAHGIDLDVGADDGDVLARGVARPLDAQPNQRPGRPTYQVGKLSQRQSGGLDAVDRGDDVAGPQAGTCGRRPVDHRDDDGYARALVEHDPDAGDPALQHLLLDLVLLLGEVLRVAVVTERLDDAADGAHAEVLAGQHVVIDVALRKDLEHLGDELLVEHRVVSLVGCRSRQGRDREDERDESRERQAGDRATGHARGIIDQMAGTCITDRCRSIVDDGCGSIVDERRRIFRISWTSHLSSARATTYRRYQPGGVIETEPERLVRQSLGSRDGDPAGLFRVWHRT